MPRLCRTNREIEIKLPVVDVPELERRLRRTGARNHGRVFEQNTLYDTPKADFRRHGHLLRLRIETSVNGKRRALLTSKAPLPGAQPGRRARYKERLEREVPVPDPLRTDRLLRSVGLRPGFRYEKYRTTFNLPQVHAELDETPVGVFLELEGRPAAIDRIAGLLGYTPSDYIRGTYWDLYAAECRRRGCEPRNMLFAPRNLSKSSLFA